MAIANQLSNFPQPEVLAGKIREELAPTFKSIDDNLKSAIESVNGKIKQIYDEELHHEDYFSPKDKTHMKDWIIEQHQKKLKADKELSKFLNGFMEKTTAKIQVIDNIVVNELEGKIFDIH